MMLALAYIRVSTEEQAEKGNSLFEQQERAVAYCKAMGWDEPILFIDDGYSAKNINRPELTKLLERVKTESCGIVITTKLDRLSRKLFDILKLNEYFNKYNFNYVSATEGFDTSTPAGRLVLQMLGMVAEFERERISENVRNNMMSIANNTKKVISRPCFGYDVIEGELVINIEESLIIKKMAAWTLEGEGARSIVKRLNLVEKVTTKEGNQWHDKVLRELLQRETLKGDFIYNKTYKKDNKVIKRPEEEWIRIEDHHEPILDAETFEMIGQLFQGRKFIGRHVSDDRYLLSGLVICGHCKSKMNGKMNKNFSKRLGKENIHYQYLCDGYLKKSICYHHFAHRDTIENIIIEELKDLATMSSGSPRLISVVKNNSVDKEEIKNNLDKLDKKIQKQIEAYNEDLITKHDLKLAADTANTEREYLKNLLQASEEKIAEQREKELRVKANHYLNAILSGDRLKMKQTIRQMIHSIEVFDGSNIEVIYRGD
ncbi:recombinase family protein [Paenibacillus macquariensis]|uniref:Site-specific DNA recombinase n=1 Tax=Paenibacillus macquariensis TaxID=948756 RepID=A0ABY1KEX6_9BACL|nr:recombinase family protein [Paenibacillus macquariensis]MEC0092471.1 recombinase family protein [Paenibacillus macquariensis]OAB35430.1 hypothetical protein PMSM_09240 [Paenibacillus macquariensis subsp. macquariensis]SIR72740.1 site-specific DNA recombinase [Paenibacillus macquariensis]